MNICCANGFQFSSHLGNFCFGSSGCTFQFMRPVFLYFFQKFPKFRFRGKGTIKVSISVNVRLMATVRVRF